MIYSGMQELRSSLQNPDRYFIRAFGGESSASGVSVDEDSALGISAVFAAVSIISETFASVPLKLFKELDRGKQAARNHPLYWLLHNQPNEEQTSFEMREMMQAHLLLWRNCYAQIVYNGAGRIDSIWPLVPWRVRVARDLKKNLVYLVRLPGKEQETALPADEVLHVKGLGLNGVTGDNLVTRQKEALGLTIALDRFAATFFSNGAQVGGVLKHPGELSPQAKANLEKEFKDKHGGVNKAHRLRILEEGMEFQQITADPEKSQAIEQRKFQIGEVARMFNMPPHMLKDLERATFSNIEQQSIEFVMYTMRPWFVRWEQRMKISLLSERERTQFTPEFVIEGLLRGDSEQRSKYYQTMFNMGAFAPNDILERENMNPVEGGDQRFVPLNMVPLDRAGQVLDQAPAARSLELRRRIQRAHLHIFRNAAEQVVKREVNAIRAALRKHPNDAVSLRLAIDVFYAKQPDAVARSFDAAAMCLADAMRSEDGDMPPEMQRFVRSYTTSLGIREARDAMAAIAAALADDTVERMLAAWEETRASEIAEREVVRLAEEVAERMKSQMIPAA